MSKKNGFSMLEAITPMVRLLPPARLRAWRLGWYFNSAMAFITRARVELLTTLASFRTRDTVAVETLARRATLSRLMLFPPIVCGFSTIPNRDPSFSRHEAWARIGLGKSVLTRRLSALTLIQTCQAAQPGGGLGAYKKLLQAKKG